MKRRVAATQNVEQVWQRNVEAWRQSGLSQKAFCQRNHLALSTFGRWLQQLNKRSNLVSACVEIVPVPCVQAIPVSAPPVVVVMGGGRYRLELADGFQRETLREVLHVLEARG